MARTLRHRNKAERLADRAEPHLKAWVAELTDARARRYGWNRRLTMRVHIAVNLMPGLPDAPAARLTALDAAVLAEVPYLQPHHATSILQETGILHYQPVCAIDKSAKDHCMIDALVIVAGFWLL
ncbi:hypothetical protein ABT052_47675 [Streptomyces sp. NPDC002766]|uniref:hypothetical protein n=1 Tax=Streptomyces sp. NPDC002766 TaxID=3154429 RepID=UPI00332FFA48